MVIPSTLGVPPSRTGAEDDQESTLNIPHNYKLRSILQDQTDPLSDEPSPHLSKGTFFSWTKTSIRTLWGGGRATRMPWRGGSEEQAPEERWERIVRRWKDCMAICAGNQLRLVHTRGNRLREVATVTIHNDKKEKLRAATWALEFDTLHPLVCVAGDTGIIHVFDVESWQMIGAMTGHGGRITHLTTHRIRPDYILSTSHDLTARMWSLADPVDVPTMPVFWPGQKKVHDLNGDLGFSQMTIGQSERPHFIPVDALVMRTGPPGGVPDTDQAGQGKGACIAVFKGAGNILGGHDSWITCADFHPTRPFVVTCGADRAIKIWRVPDFPTPETRPERGVNYHIVERPLFSCTHLHETGIEYVAWLKEDVLVSVSSNYARAQDTNEDSNTSGEEDLSRLDVSGTIVVWQWMDLSRFAPEGLDIKEPLVKPSHWDWTESRSYLTLCKIFLFDEEEYPIHTAWSLTSVFGSPTFLLTDRGNTVHILDIQQYNECPEEVKSRMRDPEKWASRRGGVRREVRHGNRVELSAFIL
ncbi:WD40-repeat-containing domain protein [Rhizoctonia solani]|nr:WD40-repeat-containing domain protein [Rhizoctonia solani]